MVSTCPKEQSDIFCSAPDPLLDGESHSLQSFTKGCPVTKCCPAEPHTTPPVKNDFFMVVPHARCRRRLRPTHAIFERPSSLPPPHFSGQDLRALLRSDAWNELESRNAQLAFLDEFARIVCGYPTGHWSPPGTSSI
jgi:hypothetical protein